MNRYETYKDSGISWLGEVPDHWEVKRLKFLARIQNGADYKHVETNDGYPVIGSGGQFAYANSYLYDGESVLLGRKGTIDKPLYVNGKFWTVDTMYYTEILKNTYPKYLYYLTLTIDFGRYSTQTALPSMTQTALNNLVFAVPHYKEQTAIAHYLDAKLGEIDALIGKQQTLLEKLAEQRTAVITHAVTKGLNPAAPMKNSGVEWLGDVPAHWDKIAIHYLVNLKSGDSITALDLVENGEYPVFGGGGFRGYINSFTHCGKFNLIGRQGALCGNVTLANGKFFATEHAIVVTPIKKLDTKWLYYLLITMNLNQYSTSAAQPGISAEVIGRLRVPFPNFKEQATIADYLDQETAKIDRLCDTVNQTIGRLKEYRTALITQAVTGKIKVTDE
ncbi:restriction endonuclease subunit S [Neisseria sicca]|jgi:restriction modification system DNA specificity domain-containing protein|uniref:restriction endonuclease subunit S n=1 Tax=Neisseria sicca TaxID=490 RepID=UPI001932AEC1|nr:restriction endonuclease subunit S [Neisseria sicca]